jgi:hypothetical protein
MIEGTRLEDMITPERRAELRRVLAQLRVGAARHSDLWEFVLPSGAVQGVYMRVTSDVIRGRHVAVLQPLGTPQAKTGTRGASTD